MARLTTVTIIVPLVTFFLEEIMYVPTSLHEEISYAYIIHVPIAMAFYRLSSLYNYDTIVKVIFEPLLKFSLEGVHISHIFN